MRPWYEPRKNRPDIQKDAKKKKGVVGFLEILWREFFSLIGLNLLFIVTCIPIVTIPASITAMSRITVTMVQDKNHFLFADYFKAFKRDFGKSLLSGLILLVLLVAFGFAAYFYYMFGKEDNSFLMLLAGISACLLLMTVMMANFLFPMLSMVELNLKALFKNSAVLGISAFKRSVPALLFVLLFEVLCGIGLLPQSVIYIGLIMFSLTNLITSYLVVPVIEERVLEKPAPSQYDTSEDLDQSVIGEFPELESADIGEFPELDEEKQEEM